ncbi:MULTISPECIES: DUF397 domain-containing protein [unclassified Streptomyces]|uniref:DUF397 domain-containing protein n=1 Tax=unclassified Streptomyces TaxID=2593676 RepID=UPI00202F75FC|nr:MULTISPECIES: DUF397 domain-containing protein [unclassified Streptomyces]MCM1971645.1 DUF397 domain-containing protein [Streptomyces sp. G1]
MESSLELARAEWRRSSYSGNTGGDCVECVTVGSVSWRKSSYSGTSGGDCVECAAVGSVSWRKSSHSGSSGGECVEVADLTPHIAIRDSKNPDHGVVTLSPEAYSAFVNAVVAGS